MKHEEVGKLFSRRHSCRSFSDELVSIMDIGTITKAGLSAPCGIGVHASHLFVYKKGEADYKRLVDIFVRSSGRNPFYDAPVIIIECVDHSSIAPVRDGSAVIENMLLAASFINLGSCWIHAPSVFFSKDENKPLLKNIGIPKEYLVIDSVIIGHIKKS